MCESLLTRVGDLDSLFPAPSSAFVGFRKSRSNRGWMMALIASETYRCTNPNCGCEIVVTRSSKAGGGSEVSSSRGKLMSAKNDRYPFGCGSAACCG